MGDWHAALVGLAVVAGMKALDSLFKVIDRMIEHRIDRMEDDDDKESEEKRDET